MSRISLKPLSFRCHVLVECSFFLFPLVASSPSCSLSRPSTSWTSWERNGLNPCLLLIGVECLAAWPIRLHTHLRTLRSEPLQSRVPQKEMCKPAFQMMYKYTCVKPSPVHFIICVNGLTSACANNEQGTPNTAVDVSLFYKFHFSVECLARVWTVAEPLTASLVRWVAAARVCKAVCFSGICGTRVRSFVCQTTSTVTKRRTGAGSCKCPQAVWERHVPPL